MGGDSVVPMPAEAAAQLRALRTKGLRRRAC
jgi:hypothetical protein